MKRYVQFAEGVLGWIMRITLFCMMCLTTVDVTGRYVFDAPLPAAFEITQLLLAVVVFAGLPVITGRQSHVSISLVEQTLVGWSKKVQCIVVSLISAVALGWAAVSVWRQGERLLRHGDYTAYLNIRLAPFAFAFSVLIVLAALVAFALFIQYARRPAGRFERGSIGSGEF
jgi:TRAP-type C4-dicarboxylate transport system permease small subunit